MQKLCWRCWAKQNPLSLCPEQTEWGEWLCIHPAEHADKAFDECMEILQPILNPQDLQFSSRMARKPSPGKISAKTKKRLLRFATLRTIRQVEKSQEKKVKKAQLRLDKYMSKVFAQRKCMVPKAVRLVLQDWISAPRTRIVSTRFEILRVSK